MKKIDLESLKKIKDFTEWLSVCYEKTNNNSRLKECLRKAIGDLKVVIFLLEQEQGAENE